MNKIKNFFLNDETGLELSEYAVAAALIAVVCVAAFTALSGGIGDAITDLKTAIAP
ncbi:MAG TPA: Flp family type IVb pilin [Blastocatellia bacterium]|jgi:Flp pilus assembly pilin Flp